MENSHHPHRHFSPGSFVAGLLIALVIFFGIYKFLSHSSGPEKKTGLKDTAKPAAPVAEIKKTGGRFSEEHFHREHHHRHIDKDAEAIVVSPEEMTMLEKGNLSKQQKQLLELLPNAPVIYMFDFKITDYQNLYFTEGLPVVLDDKMVAGQVLHDAIKALREENFEGCSERMKLLYIKNPNDVNALFYGGLSVYCMKNMEEANALFDKVLKSKNNVFHQESLWFKAIGLLETGKKGEAMAILKFIVDSNGFYRARAADKLKELA